MMQERDESSVKLRSSISPNQTVHSKQVVPLYMLLIQEKPLIIIPDVYQLSCCMLLIQEDHYDNQDEGFT